MNPTASRDIVHLNARSGPGPESLIGGAAPRVRNRYLYDADALEPATLQSVRALLMHAHIDQRHLVAHRGALEAWLLGGGTLVFNGHVAYPFLSWLEPFAAQTHPGLDGLRVSRATPHPVFDGIHPETLTFRRGVAGFYGRGCNPAPDGAVILNTIGPNRLPVDWVLTLPGGGRLFVHSGNDIWSFGHDSAARLTPQLLDWIDSETRE